MTLSAGAALALDSGSLPERAAVHWRPPVGEENLRGMGVWWTVITFGHTVPFVIAAVGLFLLKPVTAPIGVALLIHAWAIPELYAARGTGVVRGRRRPGERAAEQRALLLLGDLLNDPARRLHAESGLVLEPGKLGTWLLGEQGALLVRPGGHRVNCYCIRVQGADLPGGDRIAHLLLALRCDEVGFATVANLTFSGAAWRVRRRLRSEQRPALEAARGHRQRQLTPGA